MANDMDIPRLQSMKQNNEKIVMVTAYDAIQARLAEAAGVDVILVGDSLGKAMLGYENNVPVTMAEMLHHCRAVVRSSKQALVVCDMPFGSYLVSSQQAVENALRLIQEGGCRAVMLEGGKEIASAVAELSRRNIRVIAHIGLLPQTATLWQGYRTQGRDEEAAWELVEAAQALCDAGAVALVLESVTAEVAKLITERMNVPTIGLGSGVDCDGQLLFFHDLLGLSETPYLKQTHVFAQGGALLQKGLQDYCQAVRNCSYPDATHSIAMEEDEAKRLY